MVYYTSITKVAYYIHVVVNTCFILFLMEIWLHFLRHTCHLLCKLDAIIAIYRLINYRVGLNTLYLT